MSLLYSIPFYPALVGEEFQGVKLQVAHVLFLGAVIAHSNGTYNCCIAGIESLASECGQGLEYAKKIRGELIRSGLLSKESNKYGEISSLSCNLGLSVKDKKPNVVGLISEFKDYLSRKDPSTKNPLDPYQLDSEASEESSDPPGGILNPVTV